MSSRTNGELFTAGSGLAKYALHPMINPGNRKGQFGFISSPGDFIANQNLVSRPLHAMLLEAPGLFLDMPDKSFLSTLQAFVETDSQTIDGINATLNVTWEDVQLPGGNVQHEFTDVKREPSEPKFGVPEKIGAPFTTMLEFWIMAGMMDPESKFAAYEAFTGKKPTDLLPDKYTMTCLFYQLDSTATKVFRAWLISNMAPHSSGPIEGKKSATNAQELITLDIPFTGFQFYGYPVCVLAQQILSNISLSGISSTLRKPWVNGVSSDVQALTKGFLKGVQEQIQTQTQ